MRTRASCVRFALLGTLLLAAVPGAGTLSLWNAAPVQAAAPAIAPPPIDNNYIVVLRDDLIGAAEVADEFTTADVDIHVSQVYESALTGFAAEIPPDRLLDLANDPRVVSIEPDRRIYPRRKPCPMAPTGSTPTAISSPRSTALTSGSMPTSLSSTWGSARIPISTSSVAMTAPAAGS